MRALGNKGEDFAVRLLKKNGYKIVERNFTVRGGEIDIVAKDGETLVFAEVKLRRDTEYGRPSEFVGRAKQEKLIYTAKCYINKYRLDNVTCRFDVIEIVGTENEKGKLVTKEVNIIKNAFGC